MLLIVACLTSGLLQAPAPRSVRLQHVAALRSAVARASVLRMDEAGKGFGAGTSNADAEARGRAELERMRASAGSAKGYDSSLQGLQGGDPEEPVEVPQEFKDTVVYGFAGFLILGGFISLFAGGSLWEPKGFEEDGSAPMEQVVGSPQSPAFGFAPTAREREQANQVVAPAPAPAPAPQAATDGGEAAAGAE